MQLSQQHDSAYESEGEQRAESRQSHSTQKKKFTVYRERRSGFEIRRYESKGERRADSRQVDSTQKKFIITVYRERQSSSETKRYEREKGRWVRRDAKKSEFQNIDYAGACKGAVVLIGGTVNKILLDRGKGESAQAAVSAKEAHCETYVKEISGVKMVGAGAEAEAGNAAAGASATYIQAEAYAKVSGAEAGAHAYLLEGITEANARAVAAETRTNAGFGVKSLGAEAG